MDALNMFFGLVTVIAFISAIAFGFYQYKQAKSSEAKQQEADTKLEEANAKLEKASASIKELEEGLLLSDFKLRKGIEYYNNGHFKNSLEVFKKYSHESEDLSEFREVIRKIFWQETRKIYAKYMGHGWSTEILIMVILSKTDKADSEYPSFLNDLLGIYEEKSESKLNFWHIPILLNQGNYEKALEYIPDYKALKTSKKTNASFRQFLTDYCNRQLEET
ncbi:TPA: hypothetical protein RUZ37_002853 [Vibrio cholerae]|nr:hypothetical protein [Vibrio cholerae]